MPTSARRVLGAKQSAGCTEPTMCRRAACPHAAGTGCVTFRPRWLWGLVTGGHKALPYRSAWEFAVGAGFIPARNRVRCVPAPVVAQAGQGGYAIRPYSVEGGMVRSARVPCTRVGCGPMWASAPTNVCSADQPKNLSWMARVARSASALSMRTETLISLVEII